MARYYDGLLRLCGFEDSEISREKPRIDEVFRRLELGPDDTKAAESWLKRHHEVELLGVRKILGIWLKELIDLVLARDEGRKLVYYGFPTIAGVGTTIAATSEKILCTCPDIVLCYSLGQIFNRLTPVLEAGERNGLPPGHGLCSLQQLRVGGMALGIIPVPDLVFTSSYYCDMGSKTDELLHDRYGHPAIYVDGSMDSRWGEFPGFQTDRASFLGQELEKALADAGAILGVKVDNQARREAASRSRELFARLSELVPMVYQHEPQPISIVTLELVRRLTNGSASQRLINQGPEAIAVLNEEVKGRIERGIGVVAKGAPRVIVIFAHFSDPSIMRMMENCGLAIPATLFASVSATRRKPLDYISGELLADLELARGVFHSGFGLCYQAADIIRETRPDGFIWNYIYNCRPMAQPSHLLKQYVEKETGVPVLSLEMDLYDSRSYSAATLRSRVEAYAEMLRARKARFS